MAWEGPGLPCSAPPGAATSWCHQQSAGPFGLLVWCLLAGDVGKEGALGLDPNHSWTDVLPHHTSGRDEGQMKVKGFQ